MPETDVNLRVTIAGLELQNPLMVASGTFGWGEVFEKVQGFDNDALGAIVLKGTTLEPRKGNPTPRLVETAGGAGIINSIGLENPGVDAVIRDHLPPLEGCKAKVIANVAGGTVEEYVEVVSRFDKADRIDAMEINISCPNVKKGGAAFGASSEMAGEVIAAVRAATGKPLIAKLSPNVTSIAEIATACVETGADALSLINTLRAMEIDVDTRRPVLGNDIGGLSGPAVKPVALLKVHEVYQAVRGAGAPVIGLGGIACARDAMQFILAGARAVQVGTALFVNPMVCTEILGGMKDLLRRMGETDINDLVGTLKLNCGE
ncbi:MAG: dihydroorotate dehydrogenase [Planctomycetes bacterium]|nr:dihydroorotate dehydrogenase [Planctomycetota bacterium]